MTLHSAPHSMAEIVLAHVAERSVLRTAEARGLVPFRLGERRRYATCSGVAWFGGYHLAVVNLYGGHLRLHRLQPPGDAGEPARLELLHETDDGLSYPEDVAVSPDGKLLAIAHSMSDDHGVSLHRLDGAALAPGRMVRRGRTFHSVRFSPDSRHLAVTGVGAPGTVEVMRASAEAGERTCLVENHHAAMKPKGIAFSSDGRFVAIGHSQPLSPVVGAQLGAVISVHRFDMTSGAIDAEPLAELAGTGSALGNVEMCTFLPARPGRPYRILAADQAADVITAIDFDPAQGKLSLAGAFAAGLSFPHGIDASADGRFVAITNYGDDTLRIARVAHPG